MNSISIVYKFKRGTQAAAPLSSVKRSVDEYYRKLYQKERVREEIFLDKQHALDNIRIRSSRFRKRPEQLQLYSSLKVKTLSVQQPEHFLRRRTSSTPRLFSLQKNCSSQNMLKGLKKPDIALDKIDLSNETKSIHCRLRRMIKKNKNEIQKGKVIVVTANFIVNEHDFSTEESISENYIQHWRQLESHAHLVWICQKEITAKKIITFSKMFSLRLDSVYLLKTLTIGKIPTVSFNSIEDQYNLKKYTKLSTTESPSEEKNMIIFSGLDIGNTAKLDASSFCHAIPIVSDQRTVVHFVRINFDDNNRLENILKILNAEKLPQLFNVNKMLKGSISSEQKFHQTNCGCRDKAVEKQSVASKIQYTRNKLAKYFTRNMSLSLTKRVRFESGDFSLQYLLGDMIKRNSLIIQEVDKYSRQYQHHEHFNTCLLKKKTSRMSEARKRLETGYNNFNYFWEF